MKRWTWAPASAVAARIVRELFPDDRLEATPEPERTFPLAAFQEEAVRRARTVLLRRGGVVVGDEVGLGKTYVALALVEEALVAGESVGIVVPAALRPTWARLTRRLARRFAKYPATGPADDRGPDRADPGIELTTHARLSRGTHNVARLREASLVVVDEAHAFRNPATHRYRALAELGAGARTVLLTATPVNNDPADLVHLVRLFAPDDGFRDIGVASLAACARPSHGRRPGGAPPRAASGVAPVEDIRRIRAEVVVRRTRALVRGEGGVALEGGPSGGTRGSARTLRFPHRAAPEVLRYSDPRIPALVTDIAGLELAPYGTGEADEGGAARTGHGATALIRMGLLKRMESSAAALAVTLRRLLRFLDRFDRAAGDGRLLRPRDHLPERAGDGDSTQLLLDAVVLEEATTTNDLPGLMESARRDMGRVRRLLVSLRGPDPKLEALATWAARRPDGQKAVVFTGFRDTAAALWRALSPGGGVARIDGSGAWLGQRPAGRRAVIERFAPVANGARPPRSRERVDLLIATDVLSEGQNLQDAAIVVSYDLPWNPVRLLQRIGRVDRLGSPHDVVRTRIFLPAEGLDDVLRLTRRLRTKLGGIAAVVGAEQAGELLARFGGGGSDERGPAQAPTDPWERLRALAHRLRRCSAGDEGVVVAAVTAAGGRDLEVLGGVAPPDCRSERVRWLVLLRARGKPWLLEVAPGGEPHGATRHATDAAAGWLAAALEDGMRGPPPPNGEISGTEAALTEVACVMERARTFLAGRLAVHDAPPPMRSRGAAASVAREVRRRLAGAGPVPEAEIVRKADLVLKALSRNASPVVEERLKRITTRHHDGRADRASLGRYLDRIATALGLNDPSRYRPSTDFPDSSEPPDTEFIAALRITVDSDLNPGDQAG